MSMLDLIRSADVTFGMLMEVAEAAGRRTVDHHRAGDDEAMWVVFGLFKDRGPPPHTLPAILFRMEALSEMVVAGRTQTWQLPGKDEQGATRVHVVLLAAAARAKLIISNRRGARPRFDVDEFLMLVLQAADAEGTA